VRHALARSGRTAAIVVSGCILLFLVAGLVEGVFRQVVHSDLARFTLIAVNAAGQHT
jgi:uncharacterized membrane protein SpoIIM required for sporulation